jgi:hypothetical protein
LVIWQWDRAIRACRLSRVAFRHALRRRPGGLRLRQQPGPEGRDIRPLGCGARNFPSRGTSQRDANDGNAVMRSGPSLRSRRRNVAAYVAFAERRNR